MAEGLLVIDVQNGLRSAAHLEDLVARINLKIDHYRKVGKPVIFMQNTDEELQYGRSEWQLVSELHVKSSDRVILKYHSDSFYETGLADLLHHRHLNQLEVCGLQTEYCIDTALRVGHDLGFHMVIEKGMHSTLDSANLTADQIISHHERVWQGTFAQVIDRETFI